MRLTIPSALLPVLALAPALAARPARAHETQHEVRRGQAVAVRAFHPGGQALKGTFRVSSPAAPDVPFLRGETDPNGWVAFVPDAPGKWRVKIADDHGHGIDVGVEAGAEAPAVLPAAAPAAPADAVSPAPAPPSPQAPPGPGPIAAFVLRPLLGVAAIGAVFALLFLAWRRKGAP